MSRIQPSNLTFLTSLSKNNNREWFAQHKDRFLAEQKDIVAFADALLDRMKSHDNIENPTGAKSLFRIYRDTRFSKDKIPYKNHWSGSFKRATAALRGGYYFHIQPGESFLGGGFWAPNPEDLKRIRQEIASDAAPLKKILKDKLFIKTFGSLQGEKVKSAPKGYAREHPEIELLKHKQFILGRNFTDKEILAPGFLKEANETFIRMRPFFDYMSEMLTTDSNGISLL